MSYPQTKGQNTFFFTGANFEKKKAPINQFTGAILGFTGAIWNIMVFHPKHLTSH